MRATKMMILREKTLVGKVKTAILAKRVQKTKTNIMHFFYMYLPFVALGFLLC